MGYRVRAGLMVIVALLLSGGLFAADKSNATQLIEMAKTNSPGLRDAITASLDAKELKEGTAWVARGPEFFFATEAAAKPELFIDGAAGPAMQNISGI